MELVPKAEFSIVTRASQAWIPELITAAGPSKKIGFPEIGLLEIDLSRTPHSTALSALVFFLNLFLGLSAQAVVFFRLRRSGNVL